MNYDIENAPARACKTIGYHCLSEGDFKQAYKAFKMAFQKGKDDWLSEVNDEKKMSKLERQMEDYMLEARLVAAILHINPNDIFPDKEIVEIED